MSLPMFSLYLAITYCAKTMLNFENLKAALEMKFIIFKTIIWVSKNKQVLFIEMQEIILRSKLFE